MFQDQALKASLICKRYLAARATRIKCNILKMGLPFQQQLLLSFFMLRSQPSVVCAMF
jgi:hypothetical protein